MRFATTPTSSLSSVPLPSATSVSHPKKKKQGKSQKTAEKTTGTFLCGSCDQPCEKPEHVTNIQLNSIQCDRCVSWSHWACANIRDEDDEALGMEWFCDTCKTVTRL